MPQLLQFNGQLFEIPDHEVDLALQRGAQPATPEQLQRISEKQEYTDAGSTAASVGLGVARGVSMGLSDWALTKSGALTPDELSKYEEYNPAASIAGEVAGGVGSLLIPGGQVAAAAKLGRGAAMAGQAARAATALPRAALRAGQAAETALGGGRIARAAGAAVEGGLYGVGSAISQDAMDRQELTAESLLSEIGMGAAFGAAFPVATGAIGATADVLQTKQRVQRAAEKIGDVMQLGIRKGKSALGDTLSSERLLGAQAIISGTDPETLKKFYRGDAKRSGAEIRKIAMAGDDKRAEHVTKLTRLNDSLEDAFNDVREEAMGELKTKNISEYFAGVDQDAAESVAMTSLAATRQKLDDMISADVSEYGLRARVKRLRGAVQRNIDLVNANIKEGGPVERTFSLVDKTKREIGKYRAMKKTMGPDAMFGIPAQDQASMEVLEELYEGLRVNLESEHVWGKAGRVQQDINQGWSKYLSDKGFRSGFLRKVGETKDWRAVMKTNPDAFDKMLYKLRRVDVDQNLEFQYIKDHNANRVELLQKIHSNYDLPPAKRAKVERAITDNEAFQHELEDAVETALIKNDWDDLSRGGIGEILGGAPAVVGGIMGGIPGAAVGVGVSGLANPRTVLHGMGRLEQTGKSMGLPSNFADMLGLGEKGKMARDLAFGDPAQMHRHMEDAADQILGITDDLPKLLQEAGSAMDATTAARAKELAAKAKAVFGEDKVAATNALRGWVNRGVEGGGEVPELLSDLLQTYNRVADSVVNTKRTKLANDAVEALSTRARFGAPKAKNALVGLGLSAGAYAIGGLPGLALGGLYMAASRPDAPMALLGMASRSFDRTNRAIKRGVSGYLTGKGLRKVTTATPALAGLDLWTGEKRKEDKNRAYFEKRNEILELANKMRQGDNPLAAMFAGQPRIQQTMADRMAKGLEYIAGNTYVPPPENPWSPPHRVPDNEIARMSRLVRTLENPMSALDRLSAGSLAADEVQLLKTVYPEIYGQIVQEAVDQLSKGDVGHKERVQLSIMLGVPIDRLVQQPAISMLQSVHAGADQEQQQAEEAPQQQNTDTEANRVSDRQQIL